MTASSRNLSIDGPRLWESLMEMARIGPGVAGGNNRQALTDADAEGRALFQAWCEAAGMTVGVDTLGTMYARREGTEPGLDPVFVGSHLDTQPTGGRYDGVLGVLAALEMVRTLGDLGLKTRRPIVVTNFTNEEGTRFAPAMMASGVIAGALSQAEVEATQDADGYTVGAELDRIGWRGEEPVGARPMHAFFELHIEQGPILEAQGHEIGVVTHGQGLAWLEVTITGQDAHTGSTPMDMRRNAGLGMARVLELVDRIARDNGPDAVGAAGKIDVYPNSRNVIPGRAVFTIDFRSPNPDVLADMQRRLHTGAREICERMGLDLSIRRTGGFEPVAFDPHCVGLVREAAAQLGYGHQDIVSGAGHDACHIASIAPTAMVMCPCKDGLSHNEAESITPEWATAGANVLMHAVLQAAELAEP
jgi:N-carbamoyl-L-amino-acid hydrolase